MAERVIGLENSSIASGAGIAASKLEHEHRATVSQTSTVAAATHYLTVNRSTGTLLSLEAAITEAIATGGDRTITIDLLRSTGAAAFASVLTSTLQFTSASTLYLNSAATISSTSMADGDLWKLTVTVAGAAGAQATGIVISLTWRENTSQ